MAGYDKYMIRAQTVKPPQELLQARKGITNLQDLIGSDFAGIRGRTQQQQQRMVGSLGSRGMLDSSIAQEGQAGLLANRESQMNQAEYNWNERNRQMILQAQQSLNEIGRFNAQQRQGAEQYNKQTAFEYEKYQQQLEAQRRASRGGMFGSLGSLIGAGIGTFGGPVGMAIGSQIGGSIGGFAGQYT